MAFDTDLLALLQGDFKNDVKVSRVSPDLRGKVVVIYGGNNLGKTSQSAKFKNPIFMPVEKGLNATNGAMVLKTSNWNDLVKNGRKLAGKKYVDLLQKGVQITIVIDGLERIGTYCKNFLYSKYSVSAIGDIEKAKGWEEYDNLVWTWVDTLISLGYTIVFLGHEKLDNKKDKYDMIGDARTIKPIRDNADIVCYLQSNGVDEENQVVPSSAWLAETPDFFARCRFPYVETYIKEFSAENLEKAIVEGITYQNEVEGAENVTFEEQQKIYESEDVNFEDTVASIKTMAMAMDKAGLMDDYYDIVDEFLGEGASVSEATAKNLESVIAIRDKLTEVLEEQ